MTRFIAFTSLVIVGAAIIQLALADLQEITCKGQKYQIDEKHQKNAKECLGKVGAASIKELNANNAGCFSRCSLIQQGLIDDAGKPHKEKIMNLMDEHLPEAIKGDWIPAIEKCLDSDGSKIDMKDEQTCKSFLPLTMCVAQAFMKICSS